MCCCYAAPPVFFSAVQAGCCRATLAFWSPCLQGVLAEDAMVWREGWPEWRKLQDTDLAKALPPGGSCSAALRCALRCAASDA